MTIGENIRQHREKKGISQIQLSRMLHRSDSGMSQVENGTIRLGIDDVVPLCRLLDIDPNTLFMWNN